MNNSKEQKARRIAALLAGYIRDTLSPAEHDELDEWVGASDRNMRLFEEFTDEKRIKLALELLHDNTNDSGVLRELQEEGIAYPQRSRILRISRYVVAASVLIVAATITFLVIQHSQKNTAASSIALVNEQEIVPSINKASLTLSDGSLIELDKAKEGTIATQGVSYITKENESIKYNMPAGEIQNTQLPNTIKTPRGGKYPVTLSDGTRLWLNAASSITYPAVFTGNERRVSISGEVYFEVASATLPGPNFQKPFIVEVKEKNMTVEVLGTHFNINAYDDDRLVKTTLVEGAVKVATGSTSSLLRPGQQAQVSDKGEINVVDDITIDAIIARKEGILQPKDDDNLGSIMRDIGRWYNTEIIFENTTLSSYSFGTTLNLNNSLSNTLNSIQSNVKNIRFRIEGRKIFVTPS